jgi:hypothetical protein
MPDPGEGARASLARATSLGPPLPRRLHCCVRGTCGSSTARARLAERPSRCASTVSAYALGAPTGSSLQAWPHRPSCCVRGSCWSQPDRRYSHRDSQPFLQVNTSLQANTSAATNRCSQQFLRTAPQVSKRDPKHPGCRVRRGAPTTPAWCGRKHGPPPCSHSSTSYTTGRGLRPSTPCIERRQPVHSTA